MKKYDLIQIRQNWYGEDPKDPTIVTSKGPVYFCSIGYIETNKTLSLDNVNTIYELGNCTRWGRKECTPESSVSKKDITYYPNDRATGVVNGDFYVISEDDPNVYVCMPFDWVCVHSKKEAEDTLMKHYMKLGHVFPYDNKGLK